MPNTTLDATGITADEDLFDLELEIGYGEIYAAPAATSYSVCTPGCISQNGGSNCSFCC